MDLAYYATRRTVGVPSESREMLNANPVVVIGVRLWPHDREQRLPLALPPRSKAGAISTTSENRPIYLWLRKLRVGSPSVNIPFFQALVAGSKRAAYRLAISIGSMRSGSSKSKTLAQKKSSAS